MTTPTVSVVMSVFNNEQFLADAVESILNQSFSDFEFIVINDGSTDGSRDVLESYQERDSRIQSHNQGNLGLIASLNKGCSLARGKYIARMDGDDIAVRDRFRWQVDFLDHHPSVGILGGALENIDVSGRVFRTCLYPLDDKAIRLAMNRLEASFCHPATMMRRDAYIAVGGYRSAFVAAEDFDLWLRMGKHSQLANLEAVILRYRIHSSQISRQMLIQQGLTMLGAIESFSSPEATEWDELKAGCVITPEVLTRHHVSLEKQEFVMISCYRNAIWTLKMMGDTAAALRLSQEMFQVNRWGHVKRSFKAYMWLLTAGLHRQQGQFLNAAIAVSRSFFIWPKEVMGLIKSLCLGN